MIPSRVKPPGRARIIVWDEASHVPGDCWKAHYEQRWPIEARVTERPEPVLRGTHCEPLTLVND